MIVDSHEHLILPIEMQIKKLKEAGVDKAILFTTTPHPEKENTMQKRKTLRAGLSKGPGARWGGSGSTRIPTVRCVLCHNRRALWFCCRWDRSAAGYPSG